MRQQRYEDALKRILKLDEELLVAVKLTDTHTRLLLYAQHADNVADIVKEALTRDHK